jgi:hypothetical protein
MDTSFHASENDFIYEDCGKCLKSRRVLRQHLKQEMKFKCTTDSCTAAFCEKGEILAHQTSHDEQKRITCNYCNPKLSRMWVNLVKNSFSNCTHIVIVILCDIDRESFLHKIFLLKEIFIVI